MRASRLIALFYLGAVLALTGQSARYLALYSHDCAVLNPAAQGSDAHKKETSAHAHHAHSQKSSHEKPEHDHNACPLCQSFEILSLDMPEVSATFLLAKTAGAEIILIPESEYRPSTAHTRARPRAPPV